MQGKVPYEYFETFFGQKNDFPKPHVITRLIEEAYNTIKTRMQKTYRQRYQEEMKYYTSLSWWEKRKVEKPHLVSFGESDEDAFDYFYNRSQEFHDFEKRLKNLQVLVDVMKMASVCKNQVWVNSFELRALENVYSNIDNYKFLQDDVESYLKNFE